MIIHKHPLDWYINRLESLDYFSMGMYGDGEWEAILKYRVGEMNTEDTIYTPELCDDLRNSLDYTSPNYYFAAPAVLNEWSGMHKMRDDIDSLTSIEFIEKDFWDRYVREGKLVPFIKQLQKMKTCIISNQYLRGLHFLDYNYFIEVEYPNCHKQRQDVDRMTDLIGDNCVYLVSAGLPAALFTQDIHAKFDRVFALDLGSIWDAFVSIGARRGWRNELYEDSDRYQEWKALYAEVLK